jgi:hypothetical protein
VPASTHAHRVAATATVFPNRHPDRMGYSSLSYTT